MQRYLICEVIEREHFPPISCDTLAEARKKLCELVAEATGNNIEAVSSAMFDESVELSGEVRVTGNSAHAERCGQNYDWTIFRFGPDFKWVPAPATEHLLAVNIRWDDDDDSLPAEVDFPPGMVDDDAMDVHLFMLYNTSYEGYDLTSA